MASFPEVAWMGMVGVEKVAGSRTGRPERQEKICRTKCSRNKPRQSKGWNL